MTFQMKDGSEGNAECVLKWIKFQCKSTAQLLHAEPPVGRLVAGEVSAAVFPEPVAGGVRRGDHHHAGGFTPALVGQADDGEAYDIFDVAIAEVKSVVEPESLGIDIRREYVPFKGIHPPTLVQISDLAW